MSTLLHRVPTLARPRGRFGRPSPQYHCFVTISAEIQEILHPAIEGMEAKHPDEGDAMYMLGRMVIAVEHLAKRLDELTANSATSSERT